MLWVLALLQQASVLSFSSHSHRHHRRHNGARITTRIPATVPQQPSIQPRADEASSDDRLKKAVLALPTSASLDQYIAASRRSIIHHSDTTTTTIPLDDDGGDDDDATMAAAAMEILGRQGKARPVLQARNLPPLKAAVARSRH